MNIRQHIPNFLTTLNLISGLVSLTLILNGNYIDAALFIFLAALFDFLDGNVARMLKAHSELGKQLDSLADMVSFGVVPGFLMFRLITDRCTGSCNTLDQLHITPYFAMLIPVCSALRLAKFNIDLRQEYNFIGLPTPANALFFASIPLVTELQPQLFYLIRIGFLEHFFSNSRILTILAVLFSYMLISDFRIFSIKFRTVGWQGNELRYILLFVAVGMLLIFSLSAIPLIIVTYILLSVFFQKYITD